MYNKCFLVVGIFTGSYSNVFFSMEVNQEKTIEIVPPQDTGHTPLHYAAMKEYGASKQAHWNNPNRRAQDAELQVHLQQVKALLENKADPNIQDYEGNTPLYYATINGNTDMVELMLDYGADPNITNNYNVDSSMALHVIANGGYREIITLFNNYKKTH